MNGALNDNIKWVPFGALVLATLIATTSWKIEKSMAPPLKPAGAANSSGAPKPVMEGKIAPLFTLPALAGGQISLADYKGKFVLLNIWATWCAPCREEMPSMQRLKKKMAGANFAMLTISIDKKKGDVEQFVKELGLTFPVALDPEQKTASKYHITGVPETFLISPAGVVTHHIIGPGTWDDPAIVSALSSAAGAAPSPGLMGLAN